MLVIHRAERADALVAALGASLRAPSADPFAPEVVAVPSKGVERWLAQQLSHVLGAVDEDGVCANVQFPSYTRVLDEAAAAADESYGAAVEAWAPERVVWPLLELVDRVVDTEAWAEPLAIHLGEQRYGRRFAVAAKLARLFDRYGRSRPELILDWRAGRDELPVDLAWQPQLWRALRAEQGPSPAELLDQACANVVAGPGFSVFGATRIAPARVRILAALARTRDVHLWLHHPSPALWDAVAAAHERPGPRRAQQPVVEHPLLASLSRDVRELQQLLQDVPHEDVHHPIAGRPATVLGRLQDELAHDRRGAPVVADDSVRVHAAHGPARQVEIAREAILGLLATDPSLEPRDIVIMCPDVEAYAPLVAASFGLAEGTHPAAQLRVRLADRSLRQTNPLLSLLSQLLELAAGRVAATQLLDLAGAAPVRRMFSFAGDDLEQLRTWTVDAGARWGIDAEHRSAYQLQAIGQGTWRQALDRVLLGVAMEDDLSWVGDVLPLDDVDSGDIDLAGRFAELVDRVEQIVDQCAGRHPVADWMTLLGDAVEQLGRPDEPWQLGQLRRELDEVAESAAGTSVELDLAEVTALLRDQLAGRPTRASFRTGTLTVCTLVPMRSVPHRVVCLLGMDDGAFPRQSIADGDDVLARDPHTGERDVRSEDRQLFLDAICAAQEHLLVTYTGADPRSGAAVPPCVPLGELLDAVDVSVLGGRDAVIVRHPLQPFDARNFRPGQLGTAAPFSFDPDGLAGARAAAGARIAAPPLLAAPLGPSESDEVVALDDLVKFFAHPAKEFLRQRLALATSWRDEDPDDALAAELDGLQEWAVGERFLALRLRDVSRQTASALERMRGQLPPGALGDATMRKVGERVDALVAACADFTSLDETARDVAITLSNKQILAGTIGGLRGSTRLAVSYSTLKAKGRLAGWITYLALAAGAPDESWQSVTVGRRSNAARYSVFYGVPPQLATALLDQLVAIRAAGLREPLPLALETSAEYARRRVAGDSHSYAVAGARGSWETDRFSPERDDPEHVLALGGAVPLDALLAAAPAADEEEDGETTRFGALARRVWNPLLAAEQERP